MPDTTIRTAERAAAERVFQGVLRRAGDIDDYEQGLMRDAWDACTAYHALPTFQQRVQPWMLECFGAEISADGMERNHRFLEESLELVQACGCTRSEAHQLVDYVFSRPVGEKHQEVGGVMVTLAALCQAQSLDMHAAGETELARVWTKVEQIRAKQAAKPRHSPLPAAPAQGVDAWEPIALAPKDRVVLLAAEFDGPGDWRIKVGYWDNHENDWVVIGASWAPTHWMPLPPAPTASPDIEIEALFEGRAENSDDEVGQ